MVGADVGFTPSGSFFGAVERRDVLALRLEDTDLLDDPAAGVKGRVSSLLADDELIALARRVVTVIDDAAACVFCMTLA